MKKNFIQFSFVCLALASITMIVSCNSGADKTEAKPAGDTMVMQKDTTNALEHLIVDNMKDPSCGMPVSAGISDTAHYKDKVLGFCSKECKDEFAKNPEANLAAAEIKK